MLLILDTFSKHNVNRLTILVVGTKGHNCLRMQILFILFLENSTLRILKNRKLLNQCDNYLKGPCAKALSRINGLHKISFFVHKPKTKKCSFSHLLHAQHVNF